jgi:hypothetical protein
MQCSRCSYIQFRLSSKCANCGHDFKKLKSSNVAEVENTFTIFATAGAGVGSDFNETTTGLDEGFQEGSQTADMEGTELYDSPSDELESQNDDNGFEDFALDLSDADGPNSEGWNIGATLTGDLSEATNANQEDFPKDSELETGEFEVQGLGFDFNADSAEASDDNVSGNVEATNEASPEQEDFFLPDEPDSTDDSNEISLETELPDSSMEPDTEPTYEEPIELTVPEVELTVSEAESTVSEVELTAPEVEMHPSIELEELSLDLETDSPAIEPTTEEQPKSPEASLDGLELKMDSSEDESPDEEPTPNN